MLCGAFFGTGLLPIFGSLTGAVLGGMTGLFLGAFNGLILAIVTRLYFSPLSNFRRYQRLMQLVSTACGVIGGIIPALALSVFIAGIASMGLLLAASIALIAGLAANLTGRELAQWYEQETRENDSND